MVPPMFLRLPGFLMGLMDQGAIARMLRAVIAFHLKLL
jgi:hypothetical protein